jgi:hypothetical protein
VRMALEVSLEVISYLKIERKWRLAEKVFQMTSTAITIWRLNNYNNIKKKKKEEKVQEIKRW